MLSNIVRTPARSAGQLLQLSPGACGLLRPVNGDGRFANPERSVGSKLMSGNDPARRDDRPLLLCGNTVGLAMMLREDIPAIARWHQDLEFSARIGTPGEVHTLEMREKFFNENAWPRPDSIEFAVILLSNGRLIGFRRPIRHLPRHDGYLVRRDR